MKDSRIGSYGAIALILATTIKLASLATLSRVDIVTALVAGHTLARWSSVLLLYRLPYLGTKGSAFAGAVTGWRVIVASILAWVICALALQRHAYIPILVSLAVTAASGAYFRHRLGGVTGDCLGAANQLAELTVYLALAANV